MFRKSSFHRWISVLRPNNSDAAFVKDKTPEPCSGVSLFVWVVARARSTLGVTRHKAVIPDFRDLEPLISVVREGRHRFIDLLEIGVGRGDFGVQFLCCPE